MKKATDKFLKVKHLFKEQVNFVTYLVNKFGKQGVQIIKVIKLIFLIDVYTLRNYGRLLSNDRYYAFEKGPVASTIDNIMEKKKEYLENQTDIEYVEYFLKTQSEKITSYSKILAIRKADEYYLLEIGKKITDKIFDLYGNKSHNELINLTHKFSAWKKHKTTLETAVRVDMNIEDLLINDGNDNHLKVTNKKLASAKRMYAYY